ncbi:hypothetical protein [Ruminococcus flavefaciens]|uniref:hypothetical protein n=1 Tax=Ruminococcus flavefaciens TaxID=1265 RepID=UPI0015645644|nr:hypothetical protein [Ruminococcus flavefaciens]
MTELQSNTVEGQLASAKRLMKAAVIVKLITNLLLSLILADWTSDPTQMLKARYLNESEILYFAVFFIFDTLFALLWLFRPYYHTIHFAIYFIGFFTLPAYVMTVFGFSGIGGIIGLFIGGFFWGVSIIPFYMFEVAKKRQMKAENKMVEYMMR